MEDSSQKMNESKTNNSISVPDTSSELLKENLEKNSKANCWCQFKKYQIRIYNKNTFFTFRWKNKIKIAKI